MPPNPDPGVARLNDATEQAFQALPDAVVLTDERGRIRFINRAARELTGYVPEELIGFNVEVLVPESKQKSHIGMRTRYQESPTARHTGATRDLQLRREDGAIIPVDISLNPLPGDGETFVAATIHDRSVEERRSLEDLLLAEIGRLVNSERDIEKIYQLVSNSLPPLIPYDRLVVTVNTGTPGLVERVHVAGLEVQGAAEGTLITAAAAKRPTSPGATIISGTLSEDIPLSLEMASAGLQSWAEAPLGDFEKPMGYLSLGSVTAYNYSDDDAKLLERVSAQISPAIENGRLFSISEAERRERIALIEIGRIISSSPELGAVWEECAEQISEILPSIKVMVHTVDSDSGTFSLYQEWGSADRISSKDAASPYEGTITGEIVRTRKPVLVDHSAPLPELQGRFPLTNWDLARSYNVNIVAVPLVHRGEVLGAVHLWRDSKIETTASHVELAERIAGQIAGSIANSSLITRLQNEARIRDDLGAIGRLLSSTQDIPSVLDTCADLIKQLIPFDRFAIVTFDEANQTKTDVHVSGMLLPDEEVGGVVPLAGSEAGRIIGTRAPTLMNADGLAELASRFPASKARLDLGLIYTLAVPLIWEDRPVGTLNFRSLSEDTYGDLEVEMAVRIAAVVAPSLATWQYMNITKRQAEEAEILAEIGRIVDSSLQISEVYEQFTQLVTKLIPFDRIVYTEFNESDETITMLFSAGIGYEGEMLGQPTPLKGGISEQSIASGESLIVDFADMALKSGKALQGYLVGLRRAGFQAILSVPLVFRGSTIGTINFDSLQSGIFTEHHRQLGNRISTQISGAFANARAHEQAVVAERAQAVAEAGARELSALNESRSQFLSNISHELKTPLTSLLAFLDIFSRGLGKGITSRQDQQLNVMQRSGRRLEVLINDLVDVSTFEDGTFGLSTGEFDAKEALEEVRLSSEPMLQLKNQNLTLRQPDRNVWLQADRDRVIQVISNLVNNASKYSGGDTEIELKATVSDTDLRISVRDSGIGISEEDQASLFAPFFRANNEETQLESGSGLGLAIVKAIIDLHDGSVSVESEFGVGTTVEVVLPDCREGPTAEHLAEQHDAAQARHLRSRLAPMDDETANS